MARPTARQAAAFIALACAAALAAALVAQHAYDLQPCPWCILQRLVMAAVGVVALAVLAVPRRAVVRAGGALMALGSACGAAAAIYQNRVAAKSYSCELSLAERIVGALRIDKALPDVFEVRASCADAAVNILGLPFEAWSALAFIGLGLLALWLAVRAPR